MIYDAQLCATHKENANSSFNSTPPLPYISPPVRPEFIHCGRILDDEQTFPAQRVENGSTIHVFERTPPMPPTTRAADVTEADITAAVTVVRQYAHPLSLVKAFGPTVIRDVLETYPEFYAELGALAILRNLQLWFKLGKTVTARRIAETYPLLILSAPFVVERFRMHGGGGNGSSFARALDEQLSDGGSSPLASDDETAAAAGGGGGVAVAAAGRSRAQQPAANAPASATLNISRNQLADALLFAGSALLRGGNAAALNADPPSNAEPVRNAEPYANANLLRQAAEIALARQTQRRLDTTSSVASGSSAVQPSSAPSTSSTAAALSATTGPAPPAASATRSRQIEATALQHALLQSTAAAAAAAAVASPPPPPLASSSAAPDANAMAADAGVADAPPSGAAAITALGSLGRDPTAGEMSAFIQAMAAEHSAELQTMRDMGLTDDMRNVHALLLCNGDVERAVNFVLGSTL